MKKALPWIGGLLLFIALAFLAFSKKGRQFDGRITLNKNDKIPYGTWVAFNLLKKEFPKATVLVNKSSPANSTALNFDTAGQVLIIIDNYFNPDEDDLDKLTGFAQQGNDVYISAVQMNYIACQFFKIKQPSYFDIYYNGIVPLQKDDNIKLKDSFFVKTDTVVFNSPNLFWYPGAYYGNYFDTLNTIFSYPLGVSFYQKTNLIGIHAKGGNIYLHSSPIALSNFFILYNDNHHYYESLFSLSSPNTKKVIWDEYFLHKKDSEYSNNESSPGLLHVIMQYENFKWAFWVASILLILYLLTESKRKQRLIPAYSKPINESLEFVQTIGKLYFEKGEHKNLAEKLTQYFLDYVRTKYKVATSAINPAFVKALARKTNITEAEISEITDSIHAINLSEKISAKQLINYHALLENFYKKA